VGASDDEDALERKVYLDRNKPKFGEQAMAPLQASGTSAGITLLLHAV
jgi:hypothetical protein